MSLISTPSLATPTDVNQTFIDAMNAGDIDSALSIWNDETVFIRQPGTEPVRGLENLRAALEEFLALKPQLDFEVLQLVEAGDVAFMSLVWTLKGTDPEGNEVAMTAVDGNVMKRQDDGTWRTVIDNPFHSAWIEDHM